MSLGTQLAIVWGLTAVGAVIAFFIMFARAKRKRDGLTEVYNQAKIVKKFRFYSSNVFTRKQFNSIVKSYNSLSCMTELQVQNKSVKIFEKAMVWAFLIPVFITVAFNNPILGILSILVSLVYYNIVITKDITDIQQTVIIEVANLVQSISLNYMEYSNIPKSVLESERGEYLSVIVDEMYDILTSIESKKKMREFIAKSPLKVLSELIEVCQTTNEYGDSLNDRGTPKFIEQLDVIEEEVGVQIKVITAQKLKFKSCGTVAMFGIFTSPIVDIFLLNFIPGTTPFIKGVFGLGIKALLIFATIASYYVISTINKPTVVASTDVSEFIYGLSIHRKFSLLVKQMKPKKYKTVTSVEANLRESLSSHSIDTLYTYKIFLAIFMFVVSFFLCLCFILISKNTILNTYTSLSAQPILVEKRMMDDIRRMDAKYFEMEEKPTGEELSAFVESSVRGLNMLDIQNQSSRLETKWKEYNSIGMKWYYLIIFYLIGIAGWFVPDMQLKLRRFMVKFEAEEDASQLLTVMITLSGTGMSVYEVLYRLHDLASIHKSAIGYACQSFTRDPILTLSILSDKSKIPEFKRMCSKLKKSVYNVPIKDAFRDITSEKMRALSKKEMYDLDTVNKKANLANLVAYIPIVIVMIFQAIAPIMVLGMSNLMDVQNTLNGV